MNFILKNYITRYNTIQCHMFKDFTSSSFVYDSRRTRSIIFGNVAVCCFIGKGRGVRNSIAVSYLDNEVFKG